ncbi:hypothetical protein [Novosphingobium olei]|uniref:Uncharacterized protein n=1 Tax=Novosphingobium olei TaxID=2728851 RepID=A0A7Y0GAP5_9SPHN|nr:hypothetical protein [Novosphingobium olei]NML93832.1 hypothetical protein [Novosphingobium olei]
MTDPQAIAAGLTDAQKRALLATPEENPWLDEYTNPPWPNIHVRADLGDLGTMRPNTRFRHAFRLTPLGIAVRSILQEQENEG